MLRFDGNASFSAEAQLLVRARRDPAGPLAAVGHEYVGGGLRRQSRGPADEGLFAPRRSHDLRRDFVPIDTARAKHRAGPEVDPVELDLIDIGDPWFLVTAGCASWHTPTSSLVAYDAAGGVLTTWPLIGRAP